MPVNCCDTMVRLERTKEDLEDLAFVAADLAEALDLVFWWTQPGGQARVRTEQALQRYAAWKRGPEPRTERETER